MAQKKQSNQTKTQKSTGFITSGLSFLILFPMLLLMLPTVLFMLMAMLPTLAALVLEVMAKAKYKYKWLCIGGVNFAGALPFLFQLWFGDNSFDGALDLFFGGVAILVIYGSALIGWVFYRCIPPIVLSFLEMNDQRRVVHLRELQAKLVAKWGEEVKSEPGKSFR